MTFRLTSYPKTRKQDKLVYQAYQRQLKILRETRMVLAQILRENVQGDARVLLGKLYTLYVLKGKPVVVVIQPPENIASPQKERPKEEVKVAQVVAAALQRDVMDIDAEVEAPRRGKKSKRNDDGSNEFESLGKVPKLDD